MCKFPTAAPRHPGRLTGRKAYRAIRIPLRLLLLLVLISSASAPSKAQDNSWRQIDQGLSVGEFSARLEKESNNINITVLKIDPRHYTFKLLSASEHDNQRMTVREWCEKFQLTAAINAGMYQKDGISSVGYMKNFKHVNNPRLGSGKTVLAFNPIDAAVPEVQLIDLECQDIEELIPKYNTLIQSIRMISCRQSNVWKQQPQKWSTVAVGIDKDGMVLFLFCQTPVSVHDFGDALLSLPLSIRGVMYMEGGSQASLHVTANGHKVEKHGDFNGGFEQSEGIRLAWPIPNVLGIVKKSGAADAGAP